MERERAITRIIELFNIFTFTIQSHNKIGLFDKNSFSEDVMIPLLREIYGFSYLRNLNREKRNFPGFDLADDHARVAVQVTSDPSIDKVKDTLSQVSEHRLYERYDRFCILTIVKKQKAYSEKALKPYLNNRFSFAPKSDIIDFDDLVFAIKTLELNQIQRIELTLEINFTKSARYFIAQQAKPETESIILQLYLNPQAEHLLDWFHITMRLTVMNQMAKGLGSEEAESRASAVKQLESIKWYLWHGNVFKALQQIDHLETDLEEEIITGESAEKLRKALQEFHTYIENNQQWIPNYGELWRAGETISTAFVESAVDQVLSKRFVKKQQMSWSRRGAHLLLQVRTRVLNEELRDKFESWYPGLGGNSEERARAA